MALASVAAVLFHSDASAQEPSEQRVKAHRDVALSGTGDAARAAVKELLLEIDNLGSAPTPELVDLVADTFIRINELHCRGKSGAPAFCGRVNVVECEWRWRVAEKKMEAANFEIKPDVSRRAYKDAGDAYIAVAERTGDMACPRQVELFYNATRAYRLARQPDLAIAAIQKGIAADPKQVSPVTPSLYRSLGAIHHYLMNFDESASAYEELARRFPLVDSARESLADALVMRLALHQTDKALKDADYYLKTFGGKDPDRAATVALAIAEHVKIDAPSKDKKLVAARVKTAADLAQKASPSVAHVRVRAMTLMGRDLEDSGKTNEAIQAYKTAIQMASQLPRDSEFESEKVIGGALMAAGEAIFRKALLQANASPPQGMPALPKAKQAEEDKWMAGAFADYLKSKEAWIQALAAELDKIKQLRPEPPPDWVVRAAAEIAMRRIVFIEEIDALFDSIAKKRTDLATRIKEASSAQLASARASARAYFALSAKYQNAAAEGEAIQGWMAKKFPEELKPIVELFALPGFIDVPNPIGGTNPGPAADRTLADGRPAP